jgi:hypothetical protein
MLAEVTLMSDRSQSTSGGKGASGDGIGPERRNDWLVAAYEWSAEGKDFFTADDIGPPIGIQRRASHDFADQLCREGLLIDYVDKYVLRTDGERAAERIREQRDPRFQQPKAKPRRVKEKTTEVNEPNSSTDSAWEFLKESVKYVPFNKYAIGLVGIAAAASIVLALLKSAAFAVLCIVVMLSLMTLVSVLSKSEVESKGTSRRYLAIGVIYFLSFMFCATVFMIFMMFFFKWPRPIGENETANQVIESLIPKSIPPSDVKDTRLSLPEPQLAHSNPPIPQQVDSEPTHSNQNTTRSSPQQNPTHSADPEVGVDKPIPIQAPPGQAAQIEPIEPDVVQALEAIGVDQPQSRGDENYVIFIKAYHAAQVFKSEQNTDNLQWQGLTDGREILVLPFDGSQPHNFTPTFELPSFNDDAKGTIRFEWMHVKNSSRLHAVMGLTGHESQIRDWLASGKTAGHQFSWLPSKLEDRQCHFLWVSDETTSDFQEENPNAFIIVIFEKPNGN